MCQAVAVAAALTVPTALRMVVVLQHSYTRALCKHSHKELASCHQHSTSAAALQYGNQLLTMTTRTADSALSRRKQCMQGAMHRRAYPKITAHLTNGCTTTCQPLMYTTPTTHHNRAQVALDHATATCQLPVVPLV